MGHSRRRRGVGHVVGGHVDRLDAGDGAGRRRGDALLELAHLRGQGGLVAHGRRHAPQQGGDLAAGLAEAEDVVHEQERLGAGVAEVLGQRQCRQGHAEAGAGRLVHLSEDHGRLVDELLPRGADFGVLHFQPDVVALPGPLADAGKDAVAAVLGGHARDEFLDDNGLSQPGPAEQPGLSAADEGGQQVDDLDARLEQLALGGEHVEGGGRGVDGAVLVGLDGPEVVDGLAQKVEHATQDAGADRHFDRPAGVADRRAAVEAVGGAQGHTADPPAAQVLLHLAGQVKLDVVEIRIHPQGVVDGRDALLGELGVKRRADHLDDLALCGCFDHVHFSSSPIRPPMISASSVVIWAWRTRL
ncbi:MAG: hypothetical protein BWX88_03018 [Planctomycetes bacterium ADurb.Bin126]|nr:MAG: hypothetical protein BWX88_03018 [Planctomycetes bacterium ADurb.Bin126]